MSRTNTKTKRKPITTHEGGKASHANALQQLRRLVMSCLLWEDGFYIDGASSADLIVAAAKQVTPKHLADVAVEARKVMNLRHVPLLLCSVLCKTGAGSSLVSDTLARVISRADELAEFVTIHAKLNNVPPSAVKKTLSAQAKKGLARAFLKFDEYQLAKYDRAGAVRLRDVLFMCHAKPDTKEREFLWGKLTAGTLATPDTWEVALSGGADKKETFERMLSDGSLGYMALLRNLRNMTEAGVDERVMRKSIEHGTGREKILPFRFVAAARACPSMERSLDKAMEASIKALPILPGKTAILVDVSGSMDWAMSGKSDMKRTDAACALAAVINAEDCVVFSFSNDAVQVPWRSGMAMIDAIQKSQPHGGTDVTSSVNQVNKKCKYDRIIVITDEQSNSAYLPKPLKDTKAYMINVANYQNGVSYGADWVHLDGFSEGVLRFIHELENVRG